MNEDQLKTLGDLILEVMDEGSALIRCGTPRSAALIEANRDSARLTALEGLYATADGDGLRQWADFMKLVAVNGFRKAQGMHPRAAKGLAACLSDLIQAKLDMRVTHDGTDGPQDHMEAFHADAQLRAAKAEARIADWLQQPMTTAHLKAETPRILFTA
jgi:hypothetical protein